MDKCYGNVKEAYTSRARPPLGTSDHKSVHLIPTYKSVFKSNKPVRTTVYRWSSDAIEELKGCFLCTNWDVFFQGVDIHTAADTVTDYISFCLSSTIPQRTIIKYPNDRPYFTKEMKVSVRRKKAAFKANDTVTMKAAQRELNKQLEEARRKYRDRAEENLRNADTKKLWDTIRDMTNMKSERKPIGAYNEIQKANELNDWFMRFETDTWKDCTEAIRTLTCSDSERILIDLDFVIKVFKRLPSNKATGPDGLSAFLLRTCADELSPVWQALFQLSVDQHTVPKIWKKSVIVPVPKKTCPNDNNDYRPIALTSNVVKVMEKIITEKLRSEVEQQLDPYQFAYSKNRSTSDAISTVVHLVLKHLEISGAYARLVFIDFSSAFNTLHIDLLLRKLAQLNVNPFLIKWYFSFLT